MVDRVFEAMCYSAFVVGGMAWSVSSGQIPDEPVRPLLVGGLVLLGVIAWLCPLCTGTLSVTGTGLLAGLEYLTAYDGIFGSVFFYGLPFLLIPVFYILMGDNPLKYKR